MVFIRSLLIALALLSLNGCIWNRTKINDAAVRDRARTIVLGKTHAEQLPKIMGIAPSSMIPLRDGRTVYVFAYGDAKTEGLSLLLVTLTKTNSIFTAVYVVTDAKGIVRNIYRSPELDAEWETWPFGA